eukprot:SAG25_NODE_160_length_13390_cov_9.002708_14_plen_194_part_00
MPRQGAAAAVARRQQMPWRAVHRAARGGRNSTETGATPRRSAGRMAPLQPTPTPRPTACRDGARVTTTPRSQVCSPPPAPYLLHASGILTCIHAGMYLNALVMFATIFGRSSVGADWPDGQVVNGQALPCAGDVLTRADAEALQRIADAVVLGADGKRRSAWIFKEELGEGEGRGRGRERERERERERGGGGG